MGPAFSFPLPKYNPAAIILSHFTFLPVKLTQEGVGHWREPSPHCSEGEESLPSKLAPLPPSWRSTRPTGQHCRQAAEQSGRHWAQHFLLWNMNAMSTVVAPGNAVWVSAPSCQPPPAGMVPTSSKEPETSQWAEHSPSGCLSRQHEIQQTHPWSLPTALPSKGRFLSPKLSVFL